MAVAGLVNIRRRPQRYRFGGYVGRFQGGGAAGEPAPPPPPAETWPDVVGSPFTYGPATGGVGGGPGPETITGGTMPYDEWIQANRGPRGFFSFGRDAAEIPAGPPQLYESPARGGGGGPNQPRFFMPVRGIPQEAQQGAYGWSTSNPRLMAAMGYADDTMRRSYFGQQGLPRFIMRNSQIIDVDEGNIQLNPSPMMAGENMQALTRLPLRSGRAVGFPTAMAPTSVGYGGWPGQLAPWSTLNTSTY